MRKVILATMVCVAFAAAGARASDERIERGRYLATIMDCGGCHTTGVFLGRPDPQRFLGGSEVGFQIPGLGIFYPPNLTPHPEDGIGAWSEAEIMAAVRTGVRPDGRILAPVMPYHHYASLTDADAAALAAYLASLPPIAGAAPSSVGPTEQPTAAYLAVVAP
ncbi:MAG TPA: c-type cytochrome [Geminicoccaceae bacterium]|nr:c-type cytochrome [Geminicoccus sp.]HMU51287.1 c-type cytochrome [Geminicoccaceae bacterium]